MKACFQIAECSLSSAKIRTLSIFLYTSNSECITIYAYYSRASSSIGYNDYCQKDLYIVHLQREIK